ncbi:hypothetical protein DRW41_03000 [Neobacillus piezotolerans]|uniref:Glutamine amidotransferase domain-containing protein n=1 Tax=Neobacillus piezotolerans TaxID=2259171 RepID=A0A3D8GVS8_9BACI|nr:hypothetical protein [Neobacillus piezotolerans]RDU38545.1 hypothetical protein DRW41_03000 [Neobacillus piezotolerans]
MARKNGIFLLFLIFSLFVSLIPFPASAAADGIKISTKTGYGGYVKVGRGFPVFITVENSGEDFKGDLLLNFYPTYSSSGARALHIDVPKGSKKTYSVSLPGISDEGQYSNPGSRNIFLYEGSWKKGKEVAFQGPNNLALKYTDQSWKTLGILSEEPDRLKELKPLPADSRIETVILDGSAIPEEHYGLEYFDYILLDGFPLSSLSPAQEEALLAWVKNGGILIAGGAANAAQAYGKLYSELPMETGTQSKADLTGLESSINPGDEFKSVPVYFGSAAKGSEVVLKSGDTPIVAKRRAGNGEILQTAFSAGEEPFSSWKGYGEWFSSILVKARPLKAGNMPGYYNPYDSYFSNVADVNAYFPSVHFSTGQIVLMLAFYVLLAGPALYFLLKRIDKREHAWWIVPSIALVCSAVIFGIGAKDRIASPQVSQMGVYKAFGGGITGVQAVSLLSNTGGDYTFSFKGGEFNGIPGSSFGPPSAPQRFAILEKGRKEDSVTFRNVEYWSTRTLYGNTSIDNSGGFETNLLFSGNRITGTIVNNFPYNFENVYIWSGTKRVELGGLKKGESLKVDQDMGKKYLTAPIIGGYGYQGPSYYGENIEKMKRERLENEGLSFLYNQSRFQNKPIVYGLTKDRVMKADLVDKREKTASISLIYQDVDVAGGLSGAFSINEDSLSFDLIPVKGGNIDYQPGAKEAFLEDGVYEYILHLPSQLSGGTIKFEEISIMLQPGQAAYSIKNAESGEFTSLENPVTSFTERPERFVSGEGEITIRLDKKGQGDPAVRLPSVTIKGEAGK